MGKDGRLAYKFAEWLDRYVTGAERRKRAERAWERVKHKLENGGYDGTAEWRDASDRQLYEALAEGNEGAAAEIARRVMNR